MRLRFSYFSGAQNFDVIRLSTYRTACKLRFVQKRCNRKKKMSPLFSHYNTSRNICLNMNADLIDCILSVCQSPLTVHLVDVWNMIEAFRDNGLNTLDHNAEINVSRLETILSSIYYQLNKRLPTTHQINVEQSIGLLLNFMVATYDRYGIGAQHREVLYCSLVCRWCCLDRNNKQQKSKGTALI